MGVSTKQQNKKEEKEVGEEMNTYSHQVSYIEVMCLRCRQVLLRSKKTKQTPYTLEQHAIGHVHPTTIREVTEHHYKKA